MKFLLIALCMFSIKAIAHDEGHGPKVTEDCDKQNGAISAVVLASEAKLGPKAALLYKAKLVRAADGGVTIQVWNKDCSPLKDNQLSTTGEGTLISGKKGKMTFQKFPLTGAKNVFTGTAPKSVTKRYNIDVKVKEGDKELLAAFDDLD